MKAPGYKLLFWHCCIPLLTGLLIYLFFSAPQLLLHGWVNKYLQWPNYYQLFKNNKGYHFFINHLPDICWNYSLASFLLFSLPNKKKFLQAAFVILIVSFSEVIQYYLPNQFTYDIIDLLFTIIISIIAIKIHRNEK